MSSVGGFSKGKGITFMVWDDVDKLINRVAHQNSPSMRSMLKMEWRDPKRVVRKKRAYMERTASRIRVTQQMGYFVAKEQNRIFYQKKKRNFWDEYY